MSKFAKRIRKLNKHARNLLVLGSAWGNIVELLDSYSSIFLIDNQKRIIKSKNIIFRENFDNLSQLHDVDIILVDLDHQNHLPELIPIFQRWSSLIIIEGPEIITEEMQKFLKSHRYQIIEIYKNHYVWKLK